MNNSVQVIKKNKFPKVIAIEEQTMSSKNAPFTDKISLIRSLILKSVKPGVIKKIYLFGSYAYGTPTESSDIDLCVVINNRFNDHTQYMKMALNLSHNNIRPIDLLVFKENQFYNITNPKGIKNTIFSEGKVLYG